MDPPLRGDPGLLALSVDQLVQIVGEIQIRRHVAEVEARQLRQALTDRDATIAELRQQLETRQHPQGA